MVSWFGGTTVPAYTAAKGAVTQLTKSLAVDCVGRNININVLVPGYMKGSVIFLASSVSDYLNGAVIPVDGAYLVK